MVPPGRHLELRADQAHAADRQRHRRRRGRQARPHLASGDLGPLSPGGVEPQRRSCDHSVRLRFRFLRGLDGRYAGPSRDCARQGRIQPWRYHGARRDRPHRRQGDAQRRRRPRRRDREPGRAARHQPDQPSGRPGLGQWRLCGGDAAAAARRRGPAHARPRHRRAVVRDRPQGEDARRQSRRAHARAPQCDDARSRADRRPRQPRGAPRRRCRRRRHPQPDELQAAGARRLLSRPAPARRRGPRPLRPAHRRHAGDPRPDTQRRRRLGGAAREPADPTSGDALFRHRSRRPGRPRRGRIRHSGVCRNGAPDGGRLVERQSRPRHRRRDGARPRRAHRDAAALRPLGRPYGDAARPR